MIALSTREYDRLHESRDEPEDVCTNCGAPDSAEAASALADLVTDYGTERLCPGCMAEALAPETSPAHLTYYAPRVAA